MSLGPIAINDTCDKLKNVMVDAVQKYQMDADESINLVRVFLMGWTATVLDAIGELDDDELRQFIYYEDEVSMDIPDNLEGCDGEEEEH